ncbi:hypothetical protein [Marinobacter salexigens]|uniref:Glycosyltransferase RgtA/B/C/D-like domain-containing protein n=1 Tax=Marinobacter salexigens TaxID=1925763 RepID=A0ABS6AF12_9GAMM|nr:hypothetical protein [Marinobacter salexigens]MBU2875737.1 hypothetical protein [Marinobacter salexigens]
MLSRQNGRAWLPLTAWKVWLVCGLGLLVALQALQFRFGYRLTADDAMFLQFLWHGWDRVWVEAEAVAKFSGRIGHYVMTPLNALGAWVSGFTSGRLLILISYYSVLVLFAHYLARLTSGNRAFSVSAFIVLVLLALHPLAYEHMPPNAYPLQNTLPFLVVLAARLALMRWPSMHWLGQLIACGSMAVAMLVSEFVFLFATALMAADHLANMAWPRKSELQARFLRLQVRTGKLVSDALVVAVVLAVYVGFRLQYPSSYEGNDPSGLANTSRFFATAMWHLSAGTVFHRLPGVDFSRVTADAWLVSGLVALITTLCAWGLLRRMPVLSAKAAITMMVCIGVLMFYIAAPLAATARQQEWCLDLQVCGYLDSRVAFPGFGVLAYALVCLLVVWFKDRWRLVVFAILALSLGLVGGVNYAANSLIANDMRARVAPWAKAEGVACSVGYSEDTIDRWLSQVQMSSLDPHRFVAMHSDMNSRVFWLEYMNFLRRSGVCPAGQQERSEPLVDAFHTSFSSWSAQGAGVLGAGWSSPEIWGVWSEGNRSELNVLLQPGVHDNVDALRLQLRPYFGPSLQQQRITVLLDGEEVAIWRYSAERHSGNDCCEATVPLPQLVLDAPLRLTLEYEAVRKPGYPGESQDVRELAVGLRSLDLIEHVSEPEGEERERVE